MTTSKITLKGIGSMPTPPAKPVETVDITPTWRGVLPMLLAAHEDGGFEGRRNAGIELARMADLADLYGKIAATEEGKALILAIHYEGKGK